MALAAKKLVHRTTGCTDARRAVVPNPPSRPEAFRRNLDQTAPRRGPGRQKSWYTVHWGPRITESWYNRDHLCRPNVPTLPVVPGAVGTTGCTVYRANIPVPMFRQGCWVRSGEFHFGSLGLVSKSWEYGPSGPRSCAITGANFTPRLYRSGRPGVCNREG